MLLIKPAVNRAEAKPGVSAQPSGFWRSDVFLWRSLQPDALTQVLRHLARDSGPNRAGAGPAGRDSQTGLAGQPAPATPDPDTRET